VDKEDYTVRYDYEIKCDECPLAAAPTCTDAEKFVDEKFESEVWQFGDLTSAGAMEVCDNVAKTFQIPTDTMQVTLEFDLLETDGDNEILIRLGDYFFSLGIVFQSNEVDVPDFATVGYFFDAQVRVLSTDETKNTITISIPDEWYKDTNSLTVGMESISGCVQIDNLELTSYCTADTLSCPADAILDQALGEENFDVSAIEVISTNSETVTFAVSQEFSNSTLCTVATWFKSPLDEQFDCPYENSVPPGEINQYEALCDDDGYARVSVFVYDSEYSTGGVTPQVVRPAECTFSPGHDSNQLSRYNYRIPCTPECPVETLSCNNGDTFYESADVTILDATVTEFANTIPVPPEAKNVYLQVELEENCNWGSDDNYYIRVANKFYLDLGQETVADGKFSLGYYEDIEVVTKSTGANSMTHTLNLPSSYFPDNRLVWGVKSMTSSACLHLTNVKAYAHCNDCVDTELVPSQSGSWKYDNNEYVTSITVDEDLSSEITVTGRLGLEGQGNGTVYPTATGPSVTDGQYVEVELHLVQFIGEFGDDPVQFSVVDTASNDEVFLELANIDESTGSKNGGVVGYVRREVALDTYNKYTVFVTIPTNYAGFAVNYYDGSVFGIADYKVTSVCTQAAEGARKLDSAIDNVVADDSHDGKEEDYSYYCLAKDYPCEDGPDFVHVCHYSSRVGYQTFCIPESDSEVLRFYAKDYCGPCIGGFAS
jgi:hypothetical protein